MLKETDEDETEPPPDRREVAYYEYPVKTICGIQKDPELGQLARGTYATVVNIANVGDEKVSFSKELELTIPPGRQEPGKREKIGEDVLGPAQALKTDCPDIIRRVFGGSPPDFFEGFTVIRSPLSLVVEAVYSVTHAGPEGKRFGGDVDVEGIIARVVYK